MEEWGGGKGGNKKIRLGPHTHIRRLPTHTTISPPPLERKKNTKKNNLGIGFGNKRIGGVGYFKIKKILFFLIESLCRGAATSKSIFVLYRNGGGGKGKKSALPPSPMTLQEGTHGSLGIGGGGGWFFSPSLEEEKRFGEWASAGERQRQRKKTL